MTVIAALFSSTNLQKIWNVFTCALREIFDENAYHRFLARTNGVRSSASYHAFLRERHANSGQCRRCC